MAMNEVKCLDCRFAEWQHTPTGRIRKQASGRCLAELPAPVYLCQVFPLKPHRGAIHIGYSGRCDAFKAKEEAA